MKKYLPVLKHCPFFAGMDEGEILSILNCVDAKIRSFDHDEYIFRAGDSTASMGLILSGSVLVIQEDLWGGTGISCPKSKPAASLRNPTPQRPVPF